MPIIGFKLDSVSAKREKDVEGKSIKINSTPTIKDIKEIDVPNIAKKALTFSFDFATTYDPDVGSIHMSGEVLYVAKDSTKVLNEWKKNKKIQPDVNMEILNFLFRRCLLKISNLADDLQLPPAIGLPRIKPTEGESKQESDYVG